MSQLGWRSMGTKVVGIQGVQGHIGRVLAWLLSNGGGFVHILPMVGIVPSLPDW